MKRCKRKKKTKLPWSRDGDPCVIKLSYYIRIGSRDYFRDEIRQRLSVASISTGKRDGHNGISREHGQRTAATDDGIRDGRVLVFRRWTSKMDKKDVSFSGGENKQRGFSADDDGTGGFKSGYRVFYCRATTRKSYFTALTDGRRLDAHSVRPCRRLPPGHTSVRSP